ncbi:MAG: DNA helicase II [Pseudomonadota bacterium]|nr:DNA helicase II [Pseudomonadota bacterium]
MDVTRIIDPLNAAQREAVAVEPGNTLVLAGAGSGKTRVLVHRMCWLCETGQATAQGILAVTFTNKAAGEMRGRIEALLGASMRSLWVGTFHGIAHRLLRLHFERAGLPRTFQILDADDQQRVIKRAIRTLGLDEALWPAREIQWFINARKEEGLRPARLEASSDPYRVETIRIYRTYEEMCKRSGLVDFAELLLRISELFRDHPDLSDHYRRRFRHVLVDEFQDTNALQYTWLKQLVGDSGTLFAVGDDDQSIYSWRGARVEHMLRFQRDFAGSRLLRLTQNYRSTATILKAANALIANNSERLGKELWTEGAEGTPIGLFSAFNELEEARYCVETLSHWHEDGRHYGECAVLYRTSAQSRVFEDALRQRAIPYRVHGGFRFYERAEVKDVLAYLRLIANRDDDAAFERVVNTPNRGIGERSLELIRETARRESVSLWKATERLLAASSAGARALGALRGFCILIECMASPGDDRPLAARVEAVIEASRLPEHYLKDKSERGEDRIENLEELARAAGEFVLDPESELDPLTAFLSQAALEAGEGQAEDGAEGVQLMTLHSAKGLEFPLVFLVGLEEGLFPHQRSNDDPAQLQEERRLCYVGITRAQERLVLTYAEARRLHGGEKYPPPSRFLRELPAELLADVRARKSMSLPPSARTDTAGGLRLGQRVRHAKFGEGVVLDLEGMGEHARIQVNFERAGTKWLVAAYAGLRAV